MNWIDEAMNDYLMFLKKSYKKSSLKRVFRDTGVTFFLLSGD